MTDTTKPDNDEIRAAMNVAFRAAVAFNVAHPSLRALLDAKEAAEDRAYKLACAIVGGEDAPGYLDSISTEQLVEIVKDQRRRSDYSEDRAFRVTTERNELVQMTHELRRERDDLQAALTEARAANAAAWEAGRDAAADVAQKHKSQHHRVALGIKSSIRAIPNPYATEAEA